MSWPHSFVDALVHMHAVQTLEGRLAGAHSAAGWLWMRRSCQRCCARPSRRRGTVPHRTTPLTLTTQVPPPRFCSTRYTCCDCSSSQAAGTRGQQKVQADNFKDFPFYLVSPGALILPMTKYICVVAGEGGGWHEEGSSEEELADTVVCQPSLHLCSHRNALWQSASWLNWHSVSPSACLLPS